MHCSSAPRVLRKTSAADDDCWGSSNVSLLPESQARARGFSIQATLCKKHYDETNKSGLVIIYVGGRGEEKIF